MKDARRRSYIEISHWEETDHGRKTRIEQGQHGEENTALKLGVMASIKDTQE